MVLTIPGLSCIEQGADFVNKYEVIIRGEIFYNSTPLVSQPGSDLPNVVHRPLTLEAYQENLALSSASSSQADRLPFRDSQT